MKKLMLLSLMFIAVSTYGQDTLVVINDTTADVTTQIADALDSLVVPIAELIADQLREAPAKGSPFTSWIGWVIGFVSLLIGFLVGQFKKKKE